MTFRNLVYLSFPGPIPEAGPLEGASMRKALIPGTNLKLFKYYKVYFFYMSACPICTKGTLILDETARALEIKCSRCGHGWHIPLTPSHVSPCMDPRFSPPEPKEITRDPFEDYLGRDEKPEEEEGE